MLLYIYKIWGNLSIIKLEHRSVYKDEWKCTWLSVSNLRKFDRAILAYKIMNGPYPVNLRERDLLPDLKYLAIQEETNLMLIS